MRSTIKYCLLLAVLFSGMKVFGQAPGFNGRLLELRFGAALNSSFFEFGANSQINDSKIKSYLPPKLGLGLEYAVTQRTSVSAYASFYPMPHTTFQVWNEETFESGYIREVDNIKLRSNMFSLQTGFRRYSEFTHYGSFWNFGASGNYYNTIIYPSIYRKTELNGVVQKNEVENLETGRQWTYNYALYIGKGRKYVFSDRLTIDYGVNFWLFLGKDKSFNIGDDYRQDLRHVVDHLMYKRSQEAHIIELFIELGILL